jgi:Rod binding domain-containing protein
VSDISTFASIPSPPISPLSTQADQLLRHPGSAATENSKIEKSAKDFESILLGSWLQQAEQSFGSLPGGDDDGDVDPGKEQFQGMAMQSLGSSMTAAGGIGIAKMISTQLHKAADLQGVVAARTLPGHTE